MKDDFHQEDNKDPFMSEFIKDNSSLPPRSTIHSMKVIEESNGSKIIRILLSSFVFVIIIAFILFFLFSDNFGSDVVDNNQTENETNFTQSDDAADDIENQLVQDDTIPVDDGNEVVLNEVKTVDDLEDNNPIEVVDDNQQSEPPPNSIETTHIVQVGENLYRISLKYYGPGYMEELAKYNNMVDSDNLTVGTVLKIPNKELLQ